MSYRCRHLLIKTCNSRNPVSRRTGQSTQGVSHEAGLAELEALAAKIVAEGNSEAVFAKYATARSDCGSYREGGDLGNFGPGDMQRQFEEGTASTPVGTMSAPVVSDSGIHLIW